MNKNILHLIKRNKELFDLDVQNYEEQLSDAIQSSSFLLLVGAVSFGQAVV